MADDNIVDFKQRLKLVDKKDEELDPLREMFGDDEIMDIFMSVLMMIRLVSITETINIRIADDQIFLESKNYMEHGEEGGYVQSAISLTKVASMYIINDDNELLDPAQLVSDFQAMLESVMHPIDDEEDEPEEPK